MTEIAFSAEGCKFPEYKWPISSTYVQCNVSIDELLFKTPSQGRYRKIFPLIQKNK